MICRIGIPGNFSRFEMERAKGLPGGLCKITDAAGGQDRGGLGGILGGKLPANAGGLVVGIDSSCLNRIGFPVRGLPTEESRYDPPFTKIREPKFLGCIFDSWFVV